MNFKYFINKWVTKIKFFIYPKPPKFFQTDDYKLLAPLFNSLNSYLQTFISILASTLIALNSVIIVIVISNLKYDKLGFLIFGMTGFIVSLIFFIGSFFKLIILKYNLIEKSQKQNFNFEKISYEIENKISNNINSIYSISILLFISFLFLLLSCI